MAFRRSSVYSACQFIKPTNRSILHFDILCRFYASHFKSPSWIKKIIDAFSLFPARKYSVKKGLSHENSVVLFRHLFYIILIAIFYLLYFPFLANFHPSISGIVLILALIWIFFLMLRIFPVFSAKMFEWLGSKE